jgi:lysophospholipase L1-like esterase
MRRALAIALLCGATGVLACRDARQRQARTPVAPQNPLRVAGDVRRQSPPRLIARAVRDGVAEHGVIAQPRVRALVARADAIVISIGGNDLYGDTRARVLSLLAPRLAMDLVLDRTQAIVTRLERESRARIVLLGLYDPYRQAALDACVNVWSAKLFERFARDARVRIVTIADLFATRARLSAIDHFHPGAAAYELIAARVAGAL